MLSERIEGKWIETFVEVFNLCKIGPGDTVAILSETLSREINVHLTELALIQLKARPFHVIVPSPPHAGPLPFRASSTTDVIRGLRPVVDAMSAAVMAVDLTLEGILYLEELPEILAAGTRLFCISDEHPEILERVKPRIEHKAKVALATEMLGKAKEMRVTSEAGTDLKVDLTGTVPEGVWGACDKPGEMQHWPGAMVLCFPLEHTVNGTVVMDAGDLNLTFKRYLESPVTLKFEDDFIVAIEGDGTDADLFRSYIDATGDSAARAMSHVGWGMNPDARWDSLAIYDRGDVNCTEHRAFAGNFLFSTGANWAAKRYTQGHFDIPLRGCTISLDNTVVVERGNLVGDLAY